MKTSESGENAATNREFSKLEALLDSLISSAGGSKGEAINTIPHVLRPYLGQLIVCLVITDCMQ